MSARDRTVLRGSAAYVHATAIAVPTEAGATAILLRGAPGSGKSRLAALWLSQVPGARLIADDRVVLRRQGDRIVASAPPGLTQGGLAGLLLTRGCGPRRFRRTVSAPLGLVIVLGDAPQLGGRAAVNVLGRRVPSVSLRCAAGPGHGRSGFEATLHRLRRVHAREALVPRPGLCHPQGPGLARQAV